MNPKQGGSGTGENLRGESKGHTHGKAKFTIYGEEIVQKEVSPSGGSGRVYLPLGWLGKNVKIIRLD